MNDAEARDEAQGIATGDVGRGLSLAYDFFDRCRAEHALGPGIELADPRGLDAFDHGVG